jgi:hypothetical protein
MLLALVASSVHHESRTFWIALEIFQYVAAAIFFVIAATRKDSDRKLVWRRSAWGLLAFGSLTTLRLSGGYY